MKFRYLGKNEEMRVFGYDFSDGATPDVTEEKFIAKLKGNAEFEVAEGASKPAAAKTEPKDKKVQPAEPGAPSAGGDGDGATGGLPGV